MTSDKYIYAVRPFLWLMRKYWKPMPNVIVAGFSQPPFKLPDGVRFLSIGKYEDYPIDLWSDSLIDALRTLPDEHVIIMLEDYWIVRPVNQEAVETAYNYMRIHTSTVKFDLCADRLYAGDANTNYGKYGKLDLVWSRPGSPYHLSLMTGIWNKRHLLSVLQRNWSPWDVEIDGTRILSRRQDLYVIGSHQWPVKHTLAFRGGDDSRLLLDELEKEDVSNLRDLGLLASWEEPANEKVQAS
jgi:hypothetical protein